jgi:hypothetical protein
VTSTDFVSERSALIVEVGVLVGCTAIETLELLFERFGSVLEADSLTVAVFVIVVLAVPVFTFATTVRIAAELVARSPIVQIPVEVA